MRARTIGVLLTGLIMFQVSSTMPQAADETAFTDARFSAMRQGDKMDYVMPEFSTLQQWLDYRQEIKKRILISTGLDPLPVKTELHVRIFDRTEHPDYTIEKVRFESYPGFFVTGNLYRPNGRPGPYPAIMNPHGHWDNGRLENSDLNSGPGRCISFARQGYIIFNYDMVGYQDSKQISHEFANTPRHQLWGINLMGVQLWNSIRGLDFLCSLPNVDTTRIACTGESGGGTQTFMLTAVDNRIKAAAPVNMVSAHFQGGCLCENAPGLRLHHFNVEIAAMAAPRPLLMVSTKQDWTVNTPTVEFPMVRSIYRLYGAEDQVQFVQFDYPHNYNKDSREAVYDWFGRWLLGQSGDHPFKEPPFTIEPREKLRIYGDKEKPVGDMTEEKLTAYLQNQAEQKFKQDWPTSAAQLMHWQQQYRPILRIILDAQIPQQVESRIIEETPNPGFTAIRLVISNKKSAQWIPALLLKPVGPVAGSCLVVHPEGKNAVYDRKTSALLPWVSKLVHSGNQVLTIDCFNSGEHICTKPVRDPALKHFLTFNRTDDQERIQDIVTAGRFLHDDAGVQLYGLERAGLWALLAAGVSDDFSAVVCDAISGTLNEESLLLQQAFMPGLARYGGALTAAACTAPRPLTLFNAEKTEFVKTIQELYKNCRVGKACVVRKNLF